MRTLLPHQRPVLAYAEDRACIALFLEMRVGKTILSLAWAHARGLKRVLLVAPLPTLAGERNWEGQIRFAGLRPVLLSDAPKDNRESMVQWQWVREIVPAIMDDGFARPGDTTWSGRILRRRATGWFLINFEALRTQPELLDYDYDAIIIDESTRIRNPKAAITKLLTRRGRHIEHRAILSGLPNPKEPMDYFTQFHFLYGDFMGFENYWACRQTLFKPSPSGFGWIPKPKTRERIKQYVHDHAYILSRKTAGIGSEKERIERTLKLSPPQRRAYRELRTGFELGGDETKWATTQHIWMMKIAGGFDNRNRLICRGKIDLLTDCLMDEWGGESVVVWFHFNHEIDAVYEHLTGLKRGPKVERLHGKLTLGRPQIQDRFQTGKTRVLLMQEAIGKFGWDLSRANTAIYFSNSYDLEARNQSEDRIIHPEKRDLCTYVDLVTRDSTDVDITSTLAAKNRNAKSFHSSLASKLNARLRRITAGDLL